MELCSYYLLNNNPERPQADRSTNEERTDDLYIYIYIYIYINDDDDDEWYSTLIYVINKNIIINLHLNRLINYYIY